MFSYKIFCDFFMGFLMCFHLKQTEKQIQIQIWGRFYDPHPIPSLATQSRHIFTSSRDVLVLGRGGWRPKKC